MRRDEINELIKYLEQKVIEAKSDPQKALDILVDAGIYDKNGELQEPYKNIWK